MKQSTRLNKSYRTEVRKHVLKDMPPFSSIIFLFDFLKILYTLLLHELFHETEASKHDFYNVTIIK
jgi:hypothetical protein